MRYFDELDEWEQHKAFATWFRANLLDEAQSEAEAVAYSIATDYSEYRPSKNFGVKGRCYNVVGDSFRDWYDKLEDDEMVQTYLYEGAIQGTGCDMSLVMAELTDGWVGADLPLNPYQDCLYENVAAAIDGVSSNYLTSLCPFSDEAPVEGSNAEWQEAWRHAISGLEWDVYGGEPFPYFDEVVADAIASKASRDAMIDEVFSTLSGYIPYVEMAVGEAFEWYGNYYIGSLWKPDWMFTCYDDFQSDIRNRSCFGEDGAFIE